MQENAEATIGQGTADGNVENGGPAIVAGAAQSQPNDEVVTKTARVAEEEAAPSPPPRRKPLNK